MSKQIERKTGDTRTEFDETLKRSFRIERAESDPNDDELISMTISSEAEIEDFPGEAYILDHSPESIRLERLQTAGVGRDTHGGDQVCSVERVDLVDRKIKVGVRFCSGARAQEIREDVKRNIRRNVSIDASIHSAVLQEMRGDGALEVYRATDWEPLGFAFEPYPADINVGVNRSATTRKKKTEKASTMEKENKDPQSINLDALRAEIKKEAVAEVQRELADAKAFKDNAGQMATMVALGRKYDCVDLAETAIKDGMGLAEFQTKILERAENHVEKTIVGRQDPEAMTVGMDKKDVKDFSIVRATRLMASGRPVDGLEGEMSKELERKLGKEAQGLFIPSDITNAQVSRMSKGVRDTIARTTMAAGNYATGGATVATDTLSMIELLRNLAVVFQLGARRLDDLQGDIEIPRQITGTTITSKSETGTSAESNPTFDSLKLTPHRLTAFVPVTRQLLAQSSEDVEAMIREDLMTQLAIKMDSLAIFGDGADGEPIGLVNVSGINSVTYGAAATWAKVVESETTVAVDNALMGSLAYLTSPTAKGKWKAKSKDTGSGQFIWEGNEVNGYAALASNQIPATGTYANRSIFGNWAEMLIAMWAGLEIIVDPYSAKKTGQIEIQVEKMWDTALHPVSFCLSTDSAAQ